MGLTLLLIGEAHLLEHDYSGACSCFYEATVTPRKTGDKWAIGIALIDWQYTESLLGDLKSSWAHIEENITNHRAIGERIVCSMTLKVLAQVVQQQEDSQSAIEYYAESLDLLRKMGIEGSIADVQYNLACFVHMQRHYQLAKKLYKEYQGMFSLQGNKEGVAKCQMGLAVMDDIYSQAREIDHRVSEHLADVSMVHSQGGAVFGERIDQISIFKGALKVCQGASDRLKQIGFKLSQVLLSHVALALAVAITPARVQRAPEHLRWAAAICLQAFSMVPLPINYPCCQKRA